VFYLSLFLICLIGSVDGSQISDVMSFIANHHVHGTKDDFLSYKDAKKAMKSRKLEMTCGSITNFTIQCLKENKIESRFILTLTLDEWNTYNNGHSMVEVFEDGGWRLWDIDLKCYFTLQGKHLNAKEFCAISSQQNYEIVRFSHNNITQEKDRDTWFGKLFSSEDGLRKFYKRACQIECIRYHGVFCFTSEEKDAPRISAYPFCGPLYYIPKCEFDLVFYNESLCF
jgi:hypothetical protein